MLERRDYRVIPSVRVQDVWPKVWDWWQSAGFAVYHVGPNHLAGASLYSRIGLRREVEVLLQEANDAIYVDIAFRARITEEGVVGGVVAAVVFWPVAALGGALSWTEYENDANALLANFWQYLWHITGRPSQVLFVTAPPFGTPVVVTPPPAPAPAQTCSRCGAACLEEWRVCPYCGQPTAAGAKPNPSS